MTIQEISDEMRNQKARCDRYCGTWNNDSNAVFTRQDVEQAFLAGLKVERPKWHKVADGDLPKDGVQVLSEKGHFVIYKGDCFCWFEYSPNADNIKLRKWEEPIAWCEKPTYTEE